MAQSFVPTLVTVKQSSDLRRSPALLKVMMEPNNLKTLKYLLPSWCLKGKHWTKHHYFEYSSEKKKQIKIQNTEGIRIEAKKRICCSVLNQHRRLLCSLVKQYNTIASLMKTIFVGCFSPLCIKTFEKGGNQMWGITGINFRTSIVFNLLFFLNLICRWY